MKRAEGRPVAIWAVNPRTEACDICGSPDASAACIDFSLDHMLLKVVFAMCASCQAIPKHLVVAVFQQIIDERRDEIASNLKAANAMPPVPMDRWDVAFKAGLPFRGDL